VNIYYKTERDVNVILSKNTEDINPYFKTSELKLHLA